MDFNVIQEALRFHKVILKTVYNSQHCLANYSVSIKNQKEVGHERKDYIVYKATFLYGPFNEYRAIAKKKYFRVLEDDELVKMVFRALSKHNTCYRFDFKKAQFVKIPTLLG